MANTWDPDAAITPEDAAALIERQFPALIPLRVVPFGVGWDNTAFLVNDNFVFRFPRRQFAATFVLQEAKYLPGIAPHVPLPIPVPVYVGQPESGYPYPFAGYALIPGATACSAELSDDERARSAVPLARFLAALHTIPIDEEMRATAPGDEIARTDLPKRAVMARERMQAIPSLPPDVDADAVLREMDRLAGTPHHPGPPCWVHGDLYARHLLVDEETRLCCGIIDWGDMHLGDPALDLSIAFGFLPPAARRAFRDAYGTIDKATWDRARFRALWYGVVLTHYGMEAGDTTIREAGEYALRHALL